MISIEGAWIKLVYFHDGEKEGEARSIYGQPKKSSANMIRKSEEGDRMDAHRTWVYVTKVIATDLGL